VCRAHHRKRARQIALRTAARPLIHGSAKAAHIQGDDLVGAVARLVGGDLDILEVTG
jgi:hypothetical protein